MGVISGSTVIALELPSMIKLIEVGFVTIVYVEHR
jgi:hypothetical protein